MLERCHCIRAKIAVRRNMGAATNRPGLELMFHVIIDEDHTCVRRPVDVTDRFNAGQERDEGAKQVGHIDFKHEVDY